MESCGSATSACADRCPGHRSPFAATGVRRSDETGLLLTDLTADGLLIRKTKIGKRCLVPLEESVHRAMEAYLRERKRRGGPDDHLFVLSTGRPMHLVYLSTVFVKLVQRIGLRAGPGKPGLRLHGLRHSFASKGHCQINWTGHVEPTIKRSQAAN